ncbi:ExeM/NucH family extracellular endonuclease [Shewanella sp. SR44-3]|uniref:ExeM/NucH family extracellular endonuclease n=1 Tax=unclassified Shewanella TaxID=196818 RepID=UPI0015FE1C24|nr:ExeM/NucH family extracellular endonuclease [Shewanella sp. SR44-3]MBB1270328.1 ExeM/NucH family extracellular endonuclease [Shewanella sp. SR44-3]
MISKTSLAVMAATAISSLSHAADNPIISEYVEGSSNNKAIELYNPSAVTIDLSQYQLKFFFNGSTSAGSSIALTGSLIAGGTYVIADNDASADILAKTQLVSNASFFNGDDAVVLYKQDEVIDSLGQVGVDPGSQWGSGDLSTQDNTIRRKTDALTADTVINDEVSLDNWLGFAKDDISDLGQFGAGPVDPDPTEPVEFACNEPMTAIHLIQGEGDASPLNGQSLDVEAVVISNQEAGLKGLFIQMSDAQVDGNPLTSEGVFLYTGNAPMGYIAGDSIRVRATVSEYQGTTQLSQTSQHTLCASAQALPTAAEITLPVSDTNELERFEGMAVHFSQPLVVNEVYNLGRYGEITLGSSRHFIGTQVAAPGADALAVSAANKRDSILLDDGLTAQNPEPIRYPAPELSASNTVRVGDLATDLDGVMHFGFGQYRVMPTEVVNFVANNPRTSAPDAVDADIKVASFNVLNYFNGDGIGGGFPTDRGAHTVSEFARQKTKIVSAMQAINADVYGLMEIENDGFGSNSAIADLVNGLNSAIGEQRYQYIAMDGAGIGTDAISVGMVYRGDKVMLQGAAQLLSSANSPLDDNGQVLFNDTKNRPMLSQSFVHQGSGEQFVVAVNHLKSKGSNCDALGDPDLNDGQANCNLTRTRAATAIAQWLNTQYPEQQVLVIGDMNAYAKEDPITALALGGFSELFQHLGQANAYSYVFSGESGQLDHALASASLLDNVIAVQEWHINTDEPRILDYNEEFKSAAQITNLYQGDAYRSSDHDPVIVSLNFTAANVAPVASFGYQVNAGQVSFTSTSTDIDGEVVSLQWNFGDDNSAQGQAVVHEYQQSGSYPVTLTVTDDGGLSHSVTQTVEVTVGPQNALPVAKIHHLKLWFFDLFFSFSSDADGYIKQHKWRFSNGQTMTGFSAIQRNRNLSSVELTVIDNEGGEGSTSLTYR